MAEEQITVERAGPAYQWGLAVGRLQHDAPKPFKSLTIPEGLGTLEERLQFALGFEEGFLGKPPRREARWFHGATKGAIYADLLKRAVRDGRLKGSVRVNGRWQHDVHEVARLHPAFGEAILARVSVEIGTKRNG